MNIGRNWIQTIAPRMQSIVNTAVKEKLILFEIFLAGNSSFRAANWRPEKRPYTGNEPGTTARGRSLSHQFSCGMKHLHELLFKYI